MTSSEQPVFFIDWCLGKTVANALLEAGVHIEHHGDHFAQNTPDTEWLSVVGDRGWVVLTKDTMLGRNENELRAIARANVKVFVQNLQGWQGRTLEGSCTAAQALKIRIGALRGFPGIRPVQFANWKVILAMMPEMMARVGRSR